MVPFVIFGAFALLAAFSLSVMPETMNTKLPETIEDVCKNTKSSFTVEFPLTSTSETINIKLHKTIKEACNKTNSSNTAVKVQEDE